MQTLTEEQRRQWDADGYLVIEGALSDDEVAFFNDELDRIRLLPGWEPGGDAIGHYAWLVRDGGKRTGGTHQKNRHSAVDDVGAQDTVRQLVSDTS